MRLESIGPQWLRIVGVVLAMASAAVSASPTLVRFAPEKDYGPFVYAEPNGQVRGLSVELLAAIAPRAGLEIQTLAPRDLGDILAGVKAGEVDLVSSLRPTPERSTFLGFSPPYVEVPAVLVMRRGEARKLGLADLDGRRVGVGKAYAVEAHVRQQFPKVNWDAQANDAIALRALASGQLDGVVADVASVLFLQRQAQLNNIEIHDAIGFQYALSFAYPLAREDLGDALSRGMRELPRSERDAIVNRWIDLGTLNYRPAALSGVNHALIALALGIAVLAVLVLLQRKRQARGRADA